LGQILIGARWLELLKDVIQPDRETHAIPMMDGPLHPNNGLDSCPIISDAFSRPDDLVFTGDGRLLVGDADGVFALDPNGDGEPTLLHRFEAPVTGVDCLEDGSLAVCLDGIGVVIKNADGEETGRLVDVDGAAVNCPTAVLFRDADEVYIAQGSSFHNEANWVHDLMQKNASGRVIRWNQRSGQADVMMDGLAYPYGLALDHDGRSLLVCESWAHMIFKIPLDAADKTTVRDVVVANLPGYPARIIALDNGGYMLAMFAMRTEMLEFVLKEDKYRREMMETIEPQYWIRPTLEPDRHFLEPLQGGGFRVLGIIKPWAPPRSYGLVIELDEVYEAIGSLHSRADGYNHGITGLSAIGSIIAATAKGNGKIINVSGAT